MKGLRTHRTFDVEGRFNHATVIDDATQLMHEVNIQYKEVGDQLYRKLSYVITSLHTEKSQSFTNEAAEDLLYVVALSLAGSTSKIDGQPIFDKDWIVGPWDEKFPSASKKTKADEQKVSKEDENKQ